MSNTNMPKKLLTALVLSLPLPFVFQMLAQKFSAEDGTSPGALYYVAVCIILVAFALLVDVLSIKSAVTVRSDAETGEAEGTADAGPEGVETGSVKWFNVNKGYGFITTSKGDDVFVHFRSIRGKGRRSLRQGQAVRFDLVDGDKGLQAENVSTQD